MNISSIDLNLLVVFEALLAEGSVTRAAVRVGLSQPAFSNALKRLRAQVGERLFVRTRHGMVPTDRAMTLAEPVRRALGELRRALDHPAFKPATAAGAVTVGLNDYLQAMLLPRLLRRVGRQAPGLVLRVRQLGPGVPEPQLSTGALDLAVDWLSVTAPPEAFASAIVFHDSYTWIVRANHPGVAGTLTLERLRAVPHVFVSPSDGAGNSPIDRELARMDLQFQVGLTIPNLLAAPWIVAYSDFAAFVPVRMARWFAKALPLQVFDLPFPLPPSTLSVKWHSRNAENLAVLWVKDQLLEVGEDLDAGVLT